MDLREGFSSPKRRSNFEAHRYCVSLRPILEKVRRQARVSVPIETSLVIPVATSTPGTSAGKTLQVSLECEKYTRLSPYRDRLEPESSHYTADPSHDRGTGFGCNVEDRTIARNGDNRSFFAHVDITGHPKAMDPVVTIVVVSAWMERSGVLFPFREQEGSS